MERIFGPLILFVAQFSKEFDKEPYDDLNLISHELKIHPKLVTNQINCEK